MSLDDINKRVYGNDAEELGSRMDAPKQYDPFEKKNAPASPFQGEQKWGKADKSMTPRQKMIVRIALAAIAVILISIAAYAGWQWYKKNLFHQDRVAVSIEGPTSADSTQVVQYVIHYKNNNKVALKNAQIILEYSENFQPTDNVNLKYLSATSSKFFVPDIKANADETVTFKGIFYAPKDFPVYLHATLQYVPSNMSNQLETKNQLAVDITNSPVVLELTLPETVVDGDTVEYVVDYKNLDTRSLADAQIRAEYPAGFVFSDSSPLPSQDQTAWYLGSLEPGQGGQIKIRGQMHGQNDETKTITVSLGHMGNDGQFALCNQREKSSKMVAPLLSISQALDGSTSGVVQPGDMLSYIIKYQNTSNIGLRNAIITEELKSNVLDFSKLKSDKGALDTAKSTITWKASDIPQLANIPPQGSGTIQFSVPVKSIIPVPDASAKNFTVNSVARIDSPDIPTPIGANKVVASNTLSLKVGSKVILDSNGYYFDEQLPNTGSPLPMEVGKETTFTVHWAITNVSNDLSGTKVTAALPTGVRWIANSAPPNEHITYDGRTSQVTWDVGDVAAGAGITSSKREVAFQIGITPQSNQAGTAPLLVNSATLTAKDVFTGQSISVSKLAIDTQLTQDTKMSSSDYQVKQQ